MGSHVRTASDSVALTFDDGPSPWTHAVLSELARTGAHATFFVRPAKSLEPVRRIAAQGHAIGYHCGLHIRHGERSREEVRAELARDLARLSDVGIEPRTWRTPWGDVAEWTPELAAERNLTLWHWSDDTHDWDGRSSKDMLADLEETLSPGAVVLMHDGIGPGALRSDAAATVELVGPLVELCRSRGLEPGKLTAREPAHA